MPFILKAARRRSRWLASSFLMPVLSLGISAAKGQQASPEQLPPIQVSPPVDETRTRAKPISDDGYGPPRVAPSTSPPGNPNPSPTREPTPVRQFAGIVGASTTVITAEDIAHSPAHTLPEIIGQTPGVQLTSLYGGLNGTGTSVDLRGFGAFATANTLLLINGRRVNDIDLQGVDFSTIPRDSIQRIEITQGNAGAVLYGDNAVGGVINIVTKTGISGPPISLRAEAGVGSFNQRLGAVSVTANQGPWSTSFFGNGYNSDGYRANNAIAQQNGVGDIRYTTPDFTAYFNVSGDNQHLGLPGGRLVDPATGVNELVTARSGTDTPLDYGKQQGANATAGFTKTLWNGGELIVDGGVRDKKQQAGFFGSFPLEDFNASYVDTRLETWSLTPRLSIKIPMFGLPSTILTGIDYYDATYHSNRSEMQSSPPLDVYDLTQQSLAAYWQQTIGILPSTDFSYGGRIQRTSVTARDTLDPNAPGYFGEQQIAPLDSSEVNHALQIGIEHRFNDYFAVFGHAASAFRTPNVDERVGASPIFDPTFTVALPRSFDLKTQTSEDVEGGFRVKAGKFEMQSSIYNMDLLNEIHFDPVNFIDYNLDPTRRYGSVTSATYRASDTVLLRGGFAYTRAVFREGQYAGNDIPLVSRYTASAGVTWNAWQKYLVVDATVRYWSSRRMDNDQPNIQPLIPASATVDLKLSGEYDRYFWSLSVNNVFNVLYYDYAIASAFTPGAFSAYPLPGRTYMLKAGATF
ncbi:iron complex outermembrane recepter protein [Bradyrhizobium erythrophlei]|uniref:Iron complex outermembrane recepter protein n=2 Tax=Bradyrhizobium erythrophlei TaxID=1437360 RepID=A0A1M5GSB2_9BRAD|nr:iron complex outermembrane recepter protein [Bradyrhizobium erythrophlei]